MPRISNAAASAPDRLNVSLPSASSVTTTSATLMPVPTVTFSSIAATVLANDSAVGASFTSMMLSVKLADASTGPPTAGSSAATVTE